MLKKTISTLLVLGWLSAPSFVSAQEEPFGPGRWWRLPQVTQRLDLTEEQRRRLDELFFHNRRKLIDLRSGLERDRFDLEALIDREPLDEGAVMAQVKRLQATRSELAIEKFHYFLEVRKILGIERFRRLEGLYGSFRERMRPGLPPMGRRGDLE